MACTTRCETTASEAIVSSWGATSPARRSVAAAHWQLAHGEACRPHPLPTHDQELTGISSFPHTTRFVQITPELYKIFGAQARHAAKRIRGGLDLSGILRKQSAASRTPPATPPTASRAAAGAPRSSGSGGVGPPPGHCGAWLLTLAPAMGKDKRKLFNDPSSGN